MASTHCNSPRPSHHAAANAVASDPSGQSRCCLGSRFCQVFIFAFVVLDRCLVFNMFAIVVGIHCEDFTDVVTSPTSHARGDAATSEVLQVAPMMWLCWRRCTLCPIQLLRHQILVHHAHTRHKYAGVFCV